MSARNVEGDLPCPVCGERSAWTVSVEGADFEYACRPGPFRLARCRCGHLRADPLPSAEEIPSLYPPTYYTVNPASPLHLRGFIYRRKVRADVRRLLRLCGEAPRSVADLGCGDAARLIRLSKTLGPPAELIGVDLRFAPETASVARAHRVQLREGDIEADLGMLREEGHDLIVMSQLIEHLRDPLGLLRRLRGKLSTRGKVVLETPELAGLDYRLFRDKYWGGYHIPRHLNLFTRSSLARLLENAGLRVLRQGSLPSPGFWIISLRNALGLNSASRGSSVFELLNFSNLPAVGLFTALDMIAIRAGFRTSNQFIVAGK